MYYIGHTANVVARITEHNAGRVRSTKPYKPFVLIYKEAYKTKSEACKREMQIKSYRHGEAFKNLVK
jgi:putative endonuclease